VSHSQKTVEDLYRLIASRRGGDPETSYTAKLFHAGRAQICKKLGEEASEIIVASLAQDKTDVIAESGDLLYHLLVLWADHGIEPDDIWAELERRSGVSGIDEKKQRKNPA